MSKGKRIIRGNSIIIRGETYERMKAYKESAGVPITVQVDKAVDEWLKKKGSA
jgi:hypothetical protein